MKNLKISFAILFSAFLVACSTSTVSNDYSDEQSSSSEEQSSSSVATKSIYEAVEESGLYTTKDSVAAYLCKFDKLPSNYVDKNDGKSLYESKTGNTFEKWNFNPWTTLGVMIGGDTFNNYADNPDNYHPTLPEGNYHEADVDYSAKNRGTKRLIYQSDCVIYYTADHYETFNKLEVEVP
jgi:guanyl-specific ribonuclease Sa